MLYCKLYCYADTPTVESDPYSLLLGIHLVQMTSLRECLAWFLGLCVCDCLNWIAVKNWVGGGNRVNELSAHRYFSTFLIHVSWEPDQFYLVSLSWKQSW